MKIYLVVRIQILKSLQGLQKKMQLRLGYELNIGNFPFIGNGKALAMGEEEGFVKTIFDKTGELLGAHMVGAEVTELLSTYYREGVRDNSR